MALDKKQVSWMYIHISVFLWGFTAILGKLIELREYPLVFFRILITVFGMLFLPKIFTELRKLKLKDVLQLSFAGVLIMIHWLTFYGSIKVSNASVAVACLSTSGIITSLMEPMILKTRFRRKDLFFGLLVIPGMALILHFEPEFQLGIVLGLISAFFSSCFGIINKGMVEKYHPFAITFVELGMGNVGLLIFFPVYYFLFPEVQIFPSLSDWGWLLVLGTVCTLLPFILSLKSLKNLSAFSVALSINLEPIYSFILAGWIFKEYEMFKSVFIIPILGWKVQTFYIGAFWIMVVLLLYILQSIKRPKAKNKELSDS